VLTEDMGLVPGNRVLLRGGNSIGMACAGWRWSRPAWWRWPPCRCCAPSELGDIIDKAQPALALCDATLLAN
jgi:2-aminobenzoate-CoA ligase